MSVGSCGSCGGGGASAISQLRQQMYQQMFQKMDTNGDGSVDKSEFENDLQAKGVSASKADALFARFDKDGSGGVSQAELAKGIRHAHRHRRAEEAGEASASGATSGGSPTSLADLFSRIDSDGDGNVSKAEFQAFGQKLSSQNTGALLAGQDVASAGSGIGLASPDFGAQAYGQAFAWGGGNGTAGDRRQNAADTLVQQMLAGLSA